MEDEKLQGRQVVRNRSFQAGYNSSLKRKISENSKALKKIFCDPSLVRKWSVGGHFVVPLPGSVDQCRVKKCGNHRRKKWRQNDLVSTISNVIVHDSPEQFLRSRVWSKLLQTACMITSHRQYSESADKGQGFGQNIK